MSYHEIQNKIPKIVTFNTYTEEDKKASGTSNHKISVT